MTHTPYHPIQPGIPKALASVIQYREVPPSSLDHSVVYKLWLLQTSTPLEQPFDYFVLPDGCIDIILIYPVHPKHTGLLL